MFGFTFLVLFFGLGDDTFGLGDGAFGLGDGTFGLADGAFGLGGLSDFALGGDGVTLFSLCLTFRVFFCFFTLSSIIIILGF